MDERCKCVNHYEPVEICDEYEEMWDEAGISLKFCAECAHDKECHEPADSAPDVQK